MLKACGVCGRVHEYGMCSAKRTRTASHSKEARFRSSSIWQRKRSEILRRDYHVCRMCLDNKRLVMDNLQVHHIVPIRRNEALKLADDNLITLCPACHALVEGDKNMIDYLKSLVRMSPPTI